MIWNNTILKNKLKQISKENPEIEDILVFGSAVRGKEKPNDLDILVLFKTRVNKEVEYVIRKEIEKKYKQISIISKTIKTSQESSFDARESILSEGISLINNQPIADTYGFRSFGMFKYSFTGWNNLKKTKFYHALNGRDKNKGIAASLELIKMSDGILLSPLDKVEELKEFMDSWKIDYKYIPILLPERLSKKRFLE